MPGYTANPTFGMLKHMSIKITVLKTNGQQGTYQQVTSALALEVVKKLNPRTLFTRGSLILGNGNPFSILNPNHIASIEVDTGLPLLNILPPGITTAKLVTDKTAFMVELDKRWPQWRRMEQAVPGSPMEALVHLELTGGWEQYVYVTGAMPDVKTERKVVETLLDLPVICVKRPSNGYNYINPSNIIRARIYHSNRTPFRPERVLPLDPQEI